MSGVAILALKLVLTPLLVGLAGLAGRRCGSEIGGWLVGIPFTSAPVAFIVVLVVQGAPLAVSWIVWR